MIYQSRPMPNVDREFMQRADRSSPSNRSRHSTGALLLTDRIGCSAVMSSHRSREEIAQRIMRRWRSRRADNRSIAPNARAWLMPSTSAERRRRRVRMTMKLLTSAEHRPPTAGCGDGAARGVRR